MAIARGVGVTVRISARTGALQITLVGARHRFKYLSYAVISGDRLVIDLWKSRPPSRTAEIRRGPAGCLALLKSSVSAGLVTASGRARRVFENQFPLVLRRSDGTVIAQRTMHVSGGRWSGQLTYHTTRTQAATLEAVETSAKDGALICIVQIRITLPASPAVAVKAYKPTAMGSYEGGVSLVGWSPDGRYVSTRLGNVWTSVGASAGKLFATRAIGTWTWSPASDCALAVTATAQRGHHRRSRWALPVNPPARI